MNQQLKQQLIKWYFRGGLFLLSSSIILSILFNQGVVAQTTNPSSGNILNQGLQGQQAVANAMNLMWNDILTSGVWEAMIWVGTFFTAGLIAIWVVKLVKDSLDNELSSDYFASFLWLFLVLILLLNQGALLRDCVLGLRGIINLTNEKVLSVQIGGMTLEDSFNNIITANSFDSWLQQEQAKCNGISDPIQKTQCENDLQQKAQQKNQQLPTQYQKPAGPIQAVKDAIGDALQKLLELWMLGMGIAFQWLVEITLLLTALIAPLAVAGSLLPLKQRPLFSWLIGFYSVGLCKLFYNVIVGLVAHLLSNTTSSGNPSGGTILFAMAVGVLAPILAVALAAGGGMTTFMSIGSLASLAAGAAGGAALGLAGQGLGMAGKAALGGAKKAGGAALGAIGRGMSGGGGGGSGGGGSGGRPRYSAGGRTASMPQLPPAQGTVSVMPRGAPDPPVRRI